MQSVCIIIYTCLGVRPPYVSNPAQNSPQSRAEGDPPRPLRDCSLEPFGALAATCPKMVRMGLKSEPNSGLAGLPRAQAQDGASALAP